MKNFEHDYCSLVKRVLFERQYADSIRKTRKVRNGEAYTVFGESLDFDMSDSSAFPLLSGRRMHPEGIFGELAAFLNSPKSLDDFEKQGCNYWKLWAKNDGSINVDYGNLWVDWNGFNQLERLIDTLKTNPTDRRMIISSWKPDTMDELDLPCCHYCYQWFVRDGQYLDMMWIQRSCDVMLGLPSDVVLAATLNVLIANKVGLKPGKIKMMLGDTHIYKEHVDSGAVEKYMSNCVNNKMRAPDYELLMDEGEDPLNFNQHSIRITNYNPVGGVKFELKA